jgi:hypothetical protein
MRKYGVLNIKMLLKVLNFNKYSKKTENNYKASPYFLKFLIYLYQDSYRHFKINLKNAIHNAIIIAIKKTKGIFYL